MGVLVDHQPLNLMKHWGMGLVPVTAIDPARRDDTHRRL